ncbi:GH92 family glycosyl hydrolase [Dysgonomonas sp. ZJ709]|uniref:GH92 family glycosyl hydrolase n=1 Tax=Dysgonomonas sp. ZJ709 TaxID=2709797 RepID=UPI0013EC2535|nr:GH92 family glycosyl hydrolase [Dysgonomonas sp. ZJ709]
MRKILLFVSTLLLSASSLYASIDDPVEYVLPRMGTQSNFALSTGNLYPYISRPWGMNSWTPQMGQMGNGWTYTYGGVYPDGKFEQKIRGFKQTHQPSPWINDYGQFSIMPITGKKVFDQNERASWFSHKTEEAKPYYYSVYLADHDVHTEFAPTDRSCIFRFTYPQNDNSYVIIDAFDKGSYVKVVPEKRMIVGYSTKNSGGVPDNFKNYFLIQFDKEFTSADIVSEGNILDKVSGQQGNHVGAIIGFKTKDGEQINARVSSSFISAEQAEINLKELGSKSLDQVAQEGKEVWNKELGKIEVSGGSIDQYRTFYTCLYRSLLFPRKFHEIDAKGNTVHYSPYNGQVLPGFMYTDTGFWDTFRCLFPFLNLMYPTVNAEIQEGLVNTYKESGFYPEWASPGHRSCMIGNNSASVLADAYLQGVKVKDTKALWEGIVHGTNNVHPKVSSTGRLGHEFYNKLGYIPCDTNIRQDASRTLEYAYNDWTIYKLGEALGRPKKEIDIYAKRALNYRNLYDAETKLMRPKLLDGTFNQDFDPKVWGRSFTEGNSWHYSWAALHDPQGNIDLMGGEKVYVNMLDSIFKMSPTFGENNKRMIHEMREMQIMGMGQYAHGNQPIQHMTYLYNYAGEPWKSQHWVRKVMDKLYSPTADGYCGDEDNGQTSAWYVFSALGFYPVCPGSGEYIIGTPLFKKTVLHLDNGNTVNIEAPNNSPENFYIEAINVNEQPYSKNYFVIADMKKGMDIYFNMSDTPNKNRGTSKADAPYSFTNELKKK